MSVFTNPASGAAEQRRAYVAAVLDLLGDQDPMSVLSGSVRWFDEATANLTEEQLRRPEASGKWSIAAILRHLADSELVWGYRLRMVLAEERPALAGYDQDRWAQRLGYSDAPREASLGMFSVLRSENLRLLGAASESDLDRVGIHRERGEESVRHMIRLYAGHDILHRNQIARVREAVLRN